MSIVSDPAPKYCLGCEYRLDHLTERRCPECGREFDPNDSATFATRWSTRSWQGHQPAIGGLLGLLIGAGIGLMAGSYLLLGVLAYFGFLMGFVAGYAMRQEPKE